jgi:scyllo-inositol 2-dehydrogenase (NADP+)
MFNIGLIGYGFAGATLHAPLINAVEGLRLTHIASSNAEKARREQPQALVSASPQAVMQAPEVDLVVIATPSATHHALAREALLAGKHVVVEKPFTLDTAQADELIALAASRGRLLSVFHNRRWDSDFLTARQQIESGVLGEINTFCSNMDRFRPQVRDRWREHDAPGSGILVDLGSHLIDQALQLFGMPRTVMADFGPQRPGSPSVDYFHLVLGYGSRRVLLHAGSIVARPGPRFQVHGSQGSLVAHGVDPQEDALRRGDRPGRAGWGIDDATCRTEVTLASEGATTASACTRIDSLPGDYLAYYRGMLQALRGDGPVPVDAHDARQVIRLIEAAQRSGQQQRTIALA